MQTGLSTAAISSTPSELSRASSERVLVFDVETTGTDRRRDQIIELCVQQGLDGSGPVRIWRFLPSVPISPGARAVHGITMEALEGCPSFGDCADEIWQTFESAEVVIGYNIAFDIDMLAAEYERLRLPMVDFSGKTVVDAFRLWQQCEPRSLQHAHRRFVGDSFEAAHSAAADVAATARVLQGMLRTFGLDDKNWRAIAGACDPQRPSWVGPSRHLQWNSDGFVVLGFGKHSGVAVHVLANRDPGYLQWVAEKDFPGHVVEICKQALAMSQEQFLTWAREHFGQAAPTASPPFAKASRD